MIVILRLQNYYLILLLLLLALMRNNQSSDNKDFWHQLLQGSCLELFHSSYSSWHPNRNVENLVPAYEHLNKLKLIFVLI